MDVKDINTINQAFLAANPEIRKHLKKEYDKSHPKVIMMSLKPKYAKAIYEGRKNWGTFRGHLKHGGAE
jgi:hypothetical protein